MQAVCRLRRRVERGKLGKRRPIVAKDDQTANFVMHFSLLHRQTKGRQLQVMHETPQVINSPKAKERERGWKRESVCVMREPFLSSLFLVIVLPVTSLLHN
jgi:hypothetical protein